MSIRSNIGAAVTDIAATGVDTVLANYSARIGVSALSLFNTSGADRAVSLYISPDLTSASGKQVAEYSIPTLQSQLVLEIIGQGLSSNENLIAVISTAASIAGDVNAKLSYIEYTGSS